MPMLMLMLLIMLMLTPIPTRLAYVEKSYTLTDEKSISTVLFFVQSCSMLSLSVDLLSTLPGYAYPTIRDAGGPSRLNACSLSVFTFYHHAK